MWLFLTVQLVGLECVIVVFPDHTHLLFCGRVHGSLRDCISDSLPFNVPVPLKVVRDDKQKNNISSK